MKDAVDNFLVITGYNLETYLLDYALFIDQYREPILNYYQGLNEEVPSVELTELERLIKEGLKIRDIFFYNKDSFQTFDFWELVDTIDDSIIKLETISNASKWFRSAVTDSGFRPTSEFDFTLKQNQTVENLASDIGYVDKEQDWIKLALRNDLREEGYTSQGAVVLKASFQENVTINVVTVIDNINGINVYGKDIYQFLTFENNDLKVLAYKDTLQQAFKINLELRKGDNPEFPEDGLQSSLVAGSNIGSILYPSIFRQLYQTFSKEDVFRNITVQGIKQQEDNIEFIIQAQSRLDEIIIEKIVI